MNYNNDFANTAPRYVDNNGRRSSQDAIDMAGCLFSHILNHLKAKEQAQSTPSTYMLTPQKSGAFTRLTPVKRDNDYSATTTASVAPSRFGAMLAKPVPVYLSSTHSENAIQEDD